MKPAVFLDRDGVINELVHRDGGYFSPRELEDFHVFPFVKDSVRQLKKAGFLVIVVTNQPDISRGFLGASVLDAMHEHLMNHYEIDAIYVCPHDDLDFCNCRKPQPGMIHQASNDWNLNLKQSWMVGDRDTDIAAGEAAGLTSLRIAAGSPQFYLQEMSTATHSVFSTLATTVPFIIQRNSVRP